MSHINPITKTTRPAFAVSLLELQQLGVILGAFGTALGAFGTAFNTFNNIILNTWEAIQESKQG
jgi:hypothetical protein